MSYHFSHDWRKRSGKSFARFGNFVVLDTNPLVKEANYVPIILGRPFLATSNAIINCRNGLMQLTFGNMTLELNIFHMSKKLITLEEEEVLRILKKGCLNPLMCLLLYKARGGKKRSYLYSIKRKEKFFEEKTPKLNLKPRPWSEIYIP
ncbi:hypothetical protein AAG906_005490 [Vitis piasezkii]